MARPSMSGTMRRVIILPLEGRMKMEGRGEGYILDALSHIHLMQEKGRSLVHLPTHENDFKPLYS